MIRIVNSIAILVSLARGASVSTNTNRTDLQTQKLVNEIVSTVDVDEIEADIRKGILEDIERLKLKK